MALQLFFSSFCCEIHFNHYPWFDCLDMYYSEEIGLPKTDSSRWRLRTDPLGRETWHYLSHDECEKEPQSTFVQWLLNSPDFPAPEPSDIKTPGQAASKGADFLSLLQLDNGIFPCQYKGPMFMTIGYIVANYFSKQKSQNHIDMK